MSATTDVAKRESPSFLENGESRSDFGVLQRARALSTSKASPSDVVHVEMASKQLAKEAALGHGSLQQLLEQNEALQQQVQFERLGPDLSASGVVARELAEIVRTQMMGYQVSTKSQIEHAAKSSNAKKPAKQSHGREEGEAIENTRAAGGAS